MNPVSLESIWDLWTHTGYFVRGTLLLCFANFVATVFFLWDNMRHGKGVDRLTWLFAIPIPVFGPIAYVVIGIPERERRQAREIDRPDDWRRSLE